MNIIRSIVEQYLQREEIQKVYSGPFEFSIEEHCDTGKFANQEIIYNHPWYIIHVQYKENKITVVMGDRVSMDKELEQWKSISSSELFPTYEFYHTDKIMTNGDEYSMLIIPDEIRFLLIDDMEKNSEVIVKKLKSLHDKGIGYDGLLFNNMIFYKNDIFFFQCLRCKPLNEENQDFDLLIQYSLGRIQYDSSSWISQCAIASYQNDKEKLKTFYSNDEQMVDNIIASTTFDTKRFIDSSINSSNISYVYMIQLLYGKNEEIKKYITDELKSNPFLLFDMFNPEYHPQYIYFNDLEQPILKLIDLFHYNMTEEWINDLILIYYECHHDTKKQSVLNIVEKWIDMLSI